MAEGGTKPIPPPVDNTAILAKIESLESLMEKKKAEAEKFRETLLAE